MKDHRVNERKELLSKIARVLIETLFIQQHSNSKTIYWSIKKSETYNGSIISFSSSSVSSPKVITRISLSAVSVLFS